MHKKSDLKYKILKFVRNFCFLLAFIISAAILLTTYTAPGRAAFSLFKFMSVALQSTSSINQQKNFQKPKYQTVYYPDQGAKTEALLFLPTSTHSHSAVIMSPGVGINKQDEILILKMASALRDSGITVIWPNQKDLRKDILTESSVESYKNAFLYMQNVKGVDPTKIGYFGFCVGSDIALLASSKPEISNKVSYVLDFAAYSSLPNYYADAFSQKIVGSDRKWQPNITTFSLLLENLAYRLPPGDAQILKDYFLEKTTPAESLKNLSGKGKEALQYIQSQNPNYVAEELPNLTPEIQKLSYNLSPINFTQQIKSPVFTIHDKEDNFEPVEESRTLSKALGEKSNYLETNFLDHTVLRDHLPPTIWLTQGFGLIKFLFNVFSKTA